MSTCPHCKKVLPNVKAEAIEIDISGALKRGVSYFCPLCSHVLSVSIDPLALNADILKALGKG
jgi:hypothetical protein